MYTNCITLLFQSLEFSLNGYFVYDNGFFFIEFIYLLNDVVLLLLRLTVTAQRTGSLWIAAHLIILVNISINKVIFKINFTLSIVPLAQLILSFKTTANLHTNTNRPLFRRTIILSLVEFKRHFQWSLHDDIEAWRHT